MKKQITIGDLGKAIGELTETVADLAKTIGDRFDRVDRDIRETREVLARAIEDLVTKLSAYAASTREDYERLTSRLHELEERVSFIESGRRRRSP